ncbi:hypothetical protein [Nonomuraea sp. NPDC048916]|uniref:hypothetical protein n=1 Tax=Nonomuraea sp. NPDC048916 TaxID=3154232 RepID=UPI0033EF59FB
MPFRLRVDSNGARITPWVIWVVDAATSLIMGLAITAGAPRHAAVVTPLRTALLQREPRGPMGKLPERICVDSSALYPTLSAAMAAANLNIRIERPHPQVPTAKTMTEDLHNRMSDSVLARISGGTAVLRTDNSHPADDALLSFHQFVDAVLAWRAAWNRDRSQVLLDERTQQQAGQDDEIEAVGVDDPDIVRALLLTESPHRPIRDSAVAWRQGRYHATWMIDKRGVRVRIRYTPGDNHDIAADSSSTGTSPGSAVPSPGPAGAGGTFSLPRSGKRVMGDAHHQRKQVIRPRQPARDNPPDLS